MNTTLIYLHVTGKSDPTAPPPEHYLPWSVRFIETYKKFKGDEPHELLIVHCGGMTPESQQVFSGLDCSHTSYLGGGWDIGAHQSAANELPGRFVICAATPIHFTCPGFLEAMIEARNKFGDGLYGPTASYENRPHIRNCCWAFDTDTFKQYPHIIDTRARTYRAESGDLSITRWYEDQGKPRIMVAKDGFYHQADWRKPDNIFRRGDQSNCFVGDRHSDNFETGTPEEREKQSKDADGQNVQIH